VIFKVNRGGVEKNKGLIEILYTLSDLKDAGFIHWFLMKITGKALSMTFVHTAMSSKSAEIT